MNSGKNKLSYVDLEKKIQELEEIIAKQTKKNNPAFGSHSYNSSQVREKTIRDGLWTDIKMSEKEKFHESMLDMMNGFAYCKMLYEGEKPIDYVYLVVNKLLCGLY